MFSLENFYYLLYTNLLHPANLVDSYFDPFGANSADAVVSSYYRHHIHNLSNSNLKNVLFYDQEPMLKSVIEGVLNQRPVWNSFMSCKLLANSEQSSLKQDIIDSYKFIDWYYFFHGFIALGWYRDYKHIPKFENTFSKVFISFNRLVTKDRSYRLNLVSKIMQQNLLPYGHVSLLLEDQGMGTWKDEIDNPLSLMSSNAKTLAQQYIGSLTKSLTIDKLIVPGSASADSGAAEYTILKSALWHVVSETVFYHSKLHLTEKIFKPIVARRPFILVAAPGNLQYLKSYGFKTFDAWIDESYDSIEDHDIRINKIVDELAKLCALSPDQLDQIHKDMEEVLDFNFNHFYGKFREIITNELLINFQLAIAQWNQKNISYNLIDLSQIDFDAVKIRLLL